MGVGETMKLLQLYQRFHEDIATIERCIAESVATSQETLHEVAMHLLQAGGKRVRPIFVLLCGQFGRYDVLRLAEVAIPLELIHMATLVHDDVIDQAATRRGKPTIFAQKGARVAMYAGDYLLGRAMTVSAQVRIPAVHRIVAKTMVQMVVGEFQQMRLFGQIEQTVYDYLLRIRRKTAMLIATSCQAGALISEVSERVANRLYAYGYNVGMAFQIQDDVLDLTGTAQQLGKPPGSDLRQGNVTLPVLYAMQDPMVYEAVRRCFLSNAESSAVEQAVALIRESDGIQRAEALAQRYCARALCVLDSLPAVEAREDLRTTAQILLERAY